MRVESAADKPANDGWREAQTPISSPTGALVHLRCRLPDGPPRAVVQISHGLAEHSGRYGRFAAFLAERGFAVYAHDHRGHGRTYAPDAPRGIFSAKNGTAQVLTDLDAVHDHIAAEHHGVPVIAFGHSLGAVIALNFILHHPRRAAGAALWNAAIVPGIVTRAARALLLWERFRRGSDMPSRVLPRLTFRAWGASIADARTPFDWLSTDSTEVDRYMADPLCGWDASIGMWGDIVDLVRFAADDRNFRSAPCDLPFQLVGGGADPATNGAKAVCRLARRLNRLGFSDCETKIHEESRHETLNDLDRGTAMRDFAAWAERVAAGAIATAPKAR